MSAAASPSITTTPFGVTHSEDCATGLEMLSSCGGDFTVEKRQVSYAVEDTTATPIGMNSDGSPVYPIMQVPLNSHAAVRSDTGEHLSDKTISDGYVILQNREMIDIADEICGKRKLNYEFMTLLQGGRGLAVQVDCPDLVKDLNIGGGASGLNRCRLTLVDWHDGTGALRMYFSIIRMHCANVLPALGRSFIEGKRRNNFGFFSIKHTKNMSERIEAAVSTLNVAASNVSDTAELMRKLANVKCDSADRMKFFKVIANPEGKDERDMSKRAKTMYETRMEKLIEASNNPVNLVDGYSDSWYEVLQAATYYGSHGQTVRGSDKSDDEKRYTSTNLGSGAINNIRSMELALSMSGIAE